VTTIRKLAWVAAAWALFLPGAATAAVPWVMNFSGRLASGAGDFTGTAYVTITLYDDPLASDAGHFLWSETQDTFVDAGRFHLLLGADPGNPLPARALLGPDLYAGIKVGQDVEMTPRIRVASVPFALRAEDAATLAGHGADAFAPATHTHALTGLGGTLAEHVENNLYGSHALIFDGFQRFLDFFHADAVI
jgi:hypothetical protein